MHDGDFLIEEQIFKEYQDILNKKELSPTTCLKEICNKCHWPQPQYHWKGYFIVVKIKEQTVVARVRGSTPSISKHYASAEFLRFLGFVFDYEDVETILENLKGKVWIRPELKHKEKTIKNKSQREVEHIQCTTTNKSTQKTSDLAELNHKISMLIEECEALITDDKNSLLPLDQKAENKSDFKSLINENHNENCYIQEKKEDPVDIKNTNDNEIKSSKNLQPNESFHRSLKTDKSDMSLFTMDQSDELLDYDEFDDVLSMSENKPEDEEVEETQSCGSGESWSDNGIATKLLPSCQQSSDGPDYKENIKNVVEERHSSLNKNDINLLQENKAKPNLGVVENTCEQRCKALNSKFIEEETNKGLSSNFQPSSNSSEDKTNHELAKEKLSNLNLSDKIHNELTNNFCNLNETKYQNLLNNYEKEYNTNNYYFKKGEQSCRGSLHNLQRNRNFELHPKANESDTRFLTVNNSKELLDYSKLIRDYSNARKKISSKPDNAEISKLQTCLSDESQSNNNIVSENHLATMKQNKKAHTEIVQERDSILNCSFKQDHKCHKKESNFKSEAKDLSFENSTKIEFNTTVTNSEHNYNCGHQGTENNTHDFNKVTLNKKYCSQNLQLSGKFQSSPITDNSITSLFPGEANEKILYCNKFCDEKNPINKKETEPDLDKPETNNVQDCIFLPKNSQSDEKNNTKDSSGTAKALKGNRSIEVIAEKTLNINNSNKQDYPEVIKKFGFTKESKHDPCDVMKQSRQAQQQVTSPSSTEIEYNPDVVRNPNKTYNQQSSKPKDIKEQKNVSTKEKPVVDSNNHQAMQCVETKGNKRNIDPSLAKLKQKVSLLIEQYSSMLKINLNKSQKITKTTDKYCKDGLSKIDNCVAEEEKNSGKVTGNQGCMTFNGHPLDLTINKTQSNFNSDECPLDLTVSKETTNKTKSEKPLGHTQKEKQIYNSNVDKNYNNKRNQNVIPSLPNACYGVENIKTNITTTKRKKNHIEDAYNEWRRALYPNYDCSSETKSKDVERNQEINNSYSLSKSKTYKLGVEGYLSYCNQMGSHDKRNGCIKVDDKTCLPFNFKKANKGYELQQQFYSYKGLYPNQKSVEKTLGHYKRSDSTRNIAPESSKAYYFQQGQNKTEITFGSHFKQNSWDKIEKDQRSNNFSVTKKHNPNSSYYSSHHSYLNTESKKRTQITSGTDSEDSKELNKRSCDCLEDPEGGICCHDLRHKLKLVKSSQRYNSFRSSSTHHDSDEKSKNHMKNHYSQYEEGKAVGDEDENLSQFSYYSSKKRNLSSDESECSCTYKEHGKKKRLISYDKRNRYSPVRKVIK